MRYALIFFFILGLTVSMPHFAHAEQPSVGTTIFFGVYVQCNGDGYPFDKLMKGESVPESQLYPRASSVSKVEKCMRDKGFAVKFPQGGKKNIYDRGGNDDDAALSPMEAIKQIDAMVASGDIEIDPGVKNQVNKSLQQVSDAPAPVNGSAVAPKAAPTAAPTPVTPPKSQDEPADSVKPEKKKKYIYVPSK